MAVINFFPLWAISLFLLFTTSTAPLDAESPSVAAPEAPTAEAAVYPGPDPSVVAPTTEATTEPTIDETTDQTTEPTTDQTTDTVDETTDPADGTGKGVIISPSESLGMPLNHPMCRMRYWVFLAPIDDNASISIETSRGPSRGHFPCVSGKPCYSVPDGEKWRVYVLRDYKYPEVFGEPLLQKGVFKITPNGTEVVEAFQSTDTADFQIFEVNVIASKYPRTQYHLVYSYRMKSGSANATDASEAAGPTEDAILILEFRKPKRFMSIYTAYPAIPTEAEVTSLKVMDIDKVVFNETVTESGPFFMINLFTDEKKIKYYKKVDAPTEFSIILMDKVMAAGAAVTEQYRRRAVPPSLSCVENYPCYSVPDGGNWQAYILRPWDKFPEIFGQLLTVPPGVYQAEMGEIIPIKKFLPVKEENGTLETHIIETLVIHLGVPKAQLHFLYEYEMPGAAKPVVSRLGLSFDHWTGRECALSCFPAIPPGAKLTRVGVMDGDVELTSVPVAQTPFSSVKIDLIDGAVVYNPQ